MENNKIRALKKILFMIPFGIISIILALLEWLGFAFAFMIIPAIFAYFFFFWSIAFGIVGIIFKKKVTSIIGIVLALIPIINIVIHIIVDISSKWLINLT